VELYLYSPSEPSGPAIWRNLTFYGEIMFNVLELFEIWPLLCGLCVQEHENVTRNQIRLMRHLLEGRHSFYVQKYRYTESSVIGKRKIIAL
jgi:hypothetical protein